MSNSGNINFSFIHELEGFSLTGYVPDPKHSRSGVTIGAGFDIGQCSIDELEKAFTPHLTMKLRPYTGLIKDKAERVLREKPLIITSDEAQQITSYAARRTLHRLTKEWAQSNAKTPFKDLPSPCATVITSLYFQYGSLSKRTPNFWRQVTTNDWRSALSNLRNFGDKYSSRRNKEADLLQSWLDVNHSQATRN
ncbi:hypothetical protein AHAT_40580 [Agarivorans sp. Toyoura001]|uniref:pesticin C-terminus-like muramidase n=1 Tax=Agarivorans sp. Toyoura001 TaxID=2283141 RepID=UPI0010F1F1E8|nr:pesticin C-terminus-like muramidase [Agarivorans sp. Toyoura001]GDY28168.1 hypothetical protein AHAT_40580 [Agarivorans sp. Toyoura001]